MTDTSTSLRETAPAEQPSGPPTLTPRGLARWAWRSLTSMRVALILLFLLALAAVPGSLVPQQSRDPIAVAAFRRSHPGLSTWYDRLGLFHVFSSPWFAAVYLLLMTSLVGCVVPRTRQHWQALRTPPPAAPRRMSRLPAYESWTTAVPVQHVLGTAEGMLRRGRWRVRRVDDAVASERGQLREAGNLLFHAALLGILVAVAAGALFGFKGTRLVVEGSGFADTISQYDDVNPGTLFRSSSLPPFSLDLERFTARWETGAAQRGAARSYRADVTYRPAPGAAARTATIEVNHPLPAGHAKVYLIGNGYAPEITVRDATGAVVARGPVAFLPQDAAYASIGVVKAADARPVQLGLEGAFLPTAYVDPRRPDSPPVSVFPDLGNPRLVLTAWQGDLGLDSGLPQSVYRLETAGMTQLGSTVLAPGQSWTLPHGRGTVTFDGLRRWATFQVAIDPGKGPALVSAALAIAGLLASLFVQRRRVWVRATPGEGTLTLVEVAGLARSEGTAVAESVAELADRLRAAAPAVPEGKE